jgi:hypothetical protein
MRSKRSTSTDSSVSDSARWAHEGTYYGFTSYSSITTAIGKFDCGEHQLAEGFLIHRMFDTRYYVMALVALFYRAALLDFNERAALVSRLLYQPTRTLESIQAANDLRSEFLHFSNYWHFDELANKEEEQEHFELQCRSYRVPQMKQDIDREVDSLGRSLQDHYQFRNTEAINRVAMLSLILGIGAMVTGFFGMNFGKGFEDALFKQEGNLQFLYFVGVSFALVIFIGVLAFCVYVVFVNWNDYRDILNPHHRKAHSRSLRRD